MQLFRKSHLYIFRQQKRIITVLVIDRDGSPQDWSAGQSARHARQVLHRLIHHAVCRLSGDRERARDVRDAGDRHGTGPEETGEGYLR